MGDGTTLTPIPKIRRVLYAAYGNFPVTGLNIGDLAFATDRLVLYRWSGAAWEAITMHLSSGAIGDIPAAADLPDGSLYFGTDTTLLYQVQAGAWATITAVKYTDAEALAAAIAGGLIKATSGQYTGNSTADRAIPHGLGVAPKLVIISCTGLPGNIHWLNVGTYLNFLSATGDEGYTVAEWDATNFYVGDAGDYTKSGNWDTKTYNWVAFG